MAVRDDLNAHAAPLHGFDQGNEIWVCRHECQSIDVRCEIKGIHRHLNVHTGMQRAIVPAPHLLCDDLVAGARHRSGLSQRRWLPVVFDAVGGCPYERRVPGQKVSEATKVNLGAAGGNDRLQRRKIDKDR